MIAEPEREILRKLSAAATAIAAGADDAMHLMGSVPDGVARFETMGLVERTAARALLKAVEQMQDVTARLFRTYLLAEAVDVATLTARDVANMIEKYGGLDDAYLWSGLSRLRNRLAHEYPVSATAQLERVTEAWNAAPRLQAIIGRFNDFLADRGYLP